MLRQRLGDAAMADEYIITIVNVLLFRVGDRSLLHSRWRSAARTPSRSRSAFTATSSDSCTR